MTQENFFNNEDSVDTNENCEAEKTEQSLKTINDIKHRIEKDGGFLLYHGGLSEKLILEDIGLNRFGTQQNKKGRTYGGFYLTDESSKNWTNKYAMERNGNVHGFLIDPLARILETSDTNIDRLSQEQRDNYAKDYDLIKGKDLLGRIQYVLLNKDIIIDIGIDNISVLEKSE